jgi:hypothetical protein
LTDASFYKDFKGSLEELSRKTVELKTERRKLEAMRELPTDVTMARLKLAEAKETLVQIINTG